MSALFTDGPGALSNWNFVPPGADSIEILSQQALIKLQFCPTYQIEILSHWALIEVIFFPTGRLSNCFFVSTSAYLIEILSHGAPIELKFCPTGRWLKSFFPGYFIKLNFCLYKRFSSNEKGVEPGVIISIIIIIIITPM